MSFCNSIPLLCFLVIFTMTTETQEAQEAQEAEKVEVSRDFEVNPEQSLDDMIENIAPDIGKWASVVEVTGPRDDPAFHWHHYKDSEDAVNFWPASTIKIYTVIASFELLNERDMPLDSIAIFERKTDGRWKLDAARSMTEMSSEVFHRSSNEDYTLHLRMVGIDRLNTKFLIPDRGFPHSALMRGYVLGRPYEYKREEPQRITLVSRDGKRREVIEHTWSGESYSKERGATVISDTTGNISSTRELAECMRRIMFHEHLDEKDRYDLTGEQLKLIRDGFDGELFSLANKEAGPYAWDDSTREVFPEAKFYHKGGWISNQSLDVAYIDDEASGTRFVVVVSANTGKTAVVKEMARRIALWCKVRQEQRGEAD